MSNHKCAYTTIVFGLCIASYNIFGAAASSTALVPVSAGAFEMKYGVLPQARESNWLLRLPADLKQRVMECFNADFERFVVTQNKDLGDILKEWFVAYYVGCYIGLVNQNVAVVNMRVLMDVVSAGHPGFDRLPELIRKEWLEAVQRATGLTFDDGAAISSLDRSKRDELLKPFRTGYCTTWFSRLPSDLRKVLYDNLHHTMKGDFDYFIGTPDKDLGDILKEFFVAYHVGFYERWTKHYGHVVMGIRDLIKDADAGLDFTRLPNPLQKEWLEAIYCATGLPLDFVIPVEVVVVPQTIIALSQAPGIAPIEYVASHVAAVVPVVQSPAPVPAAQIVSVPAALPSNVAAVVPDVASVVLPDVVDALSAEHVQPPTRLATIAHCIYHHRHKIGAVGILCLAVWQLRATGRIAHALKRIAVMR